MSNKIIATLKENKNCTHHKTQKAGPGITLLLCQDNNTLTPLSYQFQGQKYTPQKATEWLKKAGVEYLKITEKKNTTKQIITAKNSIEPDGRIWDAGIHHVYVEGKPAKVHVPPETILKTFEDMRNQIQNTGKVPLGLDHLEPSLFKEYPVLEKLDLLNVGGVNRIGYDGESIYILESELSDPKIKELYETGELPSYSVVGEMKASPCPTGEVDYVLNSLKIDRVDFVEEGGCQTCKVGAEPDTLILTSKKVVEDDHMVNEAQEPETEINVVDEVVSDADNITLDNESESEENTPETETEDIDEPEEEKDNLTKLLEKMEANQEKLESKIESMEKMLGGKKPPGHKPGFNAEEEIKTLIQEGRATPKMKNALLTLAKTSEKDFLEMKASLPIIVSMDTKAKLARLEEKEDKKEDTPGAFYESDEYKEALRQFGIKDD